MSKMLVVIYQTTLIIMVKLDRKKKNKSEANLEPMAKSEDAHSQSPKKQAKEEISDLVPPKEEHASASNAESSQVSIQKKDCEEIPKNDFKANRETSDAKEESTALRALVPKARAQEDYFKGNSNQAKRVRRREKKKIWTVLDLMPTRREIASGSQTKQRPVVTRKVTLEELPKRDKLVELSSKMKEYCEVKKVPRRDANVEMWLEKHLNYFNSPEAKPEEDDLKDDPLPSSYHTEVDNKKTFIDAEGRGEPTKEEELEEHITTNNNISRPTDFKWGNKKTNTFFNNHSQDVMPSAKKMQLEAAFSPANSSLNLGNAAFMGNNASASKICYSAFTKQNVKPQPTHLANNCVQSWCCPNWGTTMSQAPSPSLMPRQGRAEFSIDKMKRLAMGVQRDNGQRSEPSGSKVVGNEQKPSGYRYGRAKPMLRQTIEEKPKIRDGERKNGRGRGNGRKK